MPKLKMIEIYSGKDEQWRGWHNLILDLDGTVGNSKSIQGPIDPKTSEQIKQALNLNCADMSEQEYEIAVSEREDCPILTAHCDFYSHQCDRNGEVAICHCSHPDNLNTNEGNCLHYLCPLGEASDEYS